MSGDRGVKRAAARAQHVTPGPRGVRVGGHDHMLFRVDSPLLPDAGRRLGSIVGTLAEGRGERREACQPRQENENARAQGLAFMRD